MTPHLELTIHKTTHFVLPFFSFYFSLLGKWMLCFTIHSYTTYIILKYSSKHQVGLKESAGSIKGLIRVNWPSLSGLRSWLHKKDTFSEVQ